MLGRKQPLNLGTMPAVTELGDVARACLRCGVGVRVDDPDPYVRIVTAVGREPRNDVEAMARPDKAFSRDFTFTLCMQCVARRNHAADVVERCPDLNRRYGSPTVTVQRVWNAMDGLHLAGVAVPAVNDIRSWVYAIEHMQMIGAGATWAAQFAPVWRLGVQDRTGATSPRSHATDVESRARDAAAGMLAAKSDVPRPHECPTGGCLYCGVGTVTALRSADPWTAHRFNLASVGGGHEERDGHLCPTCERGYRDEGANGRSAVARALLAGFGFVPGWQGYPEFSTLKAWAATGRRPQAIPFGWVSNLDDLRRQYGHR